MKYLAIIISLFVVGFSFAQDATTRTGTSLQDKYTAMKTSSQTFHDYKVVKEVILDGVWRAVLDSMKNQRALTATANATIVQKQAELAKEQTAMVQLTSSIEGITFESEHINFLGINFLKASFITLAILLVASLVFIMVLLLGKLKLLSYSAKEKIEFANLLSQEFEEFKKKSLERQAKLSRELQNELNKSYPGQNMLANHKSINSAVPLL